MANAIYPKWKEARLQGTANAALDGSGTTGLYMVLVDTGTYTYSAAHEFYSDLSGIVGTEVELGTKTYTDGVLDFADPTFTSVSGNSVEALITFVKNAGANTTWRLHSFVDTNVTNLPVTPNGGNITLTVNASGYVAL